MSMTMNVMMMTVASSEPIRLSEAAGVLIVAWFAVLFCWDEFIVWWNNRKNK